MPCRAEEWSRGTEAVGCARLVGVQAYYQLGEVYRALRLVVNC